MCENQSTAKIFGDFARMQRRIGKDLARATKKRCDQLRAASNFGDYLVTGLGKPHSLLGDLEGYYSISVSGNVRLVIKPDSEGTNPDSLSSCETVVVKGLVDYHGQKDEWLIP